MRIALISDIHSNCIALDAVLADIRLKGVDQIVCLGDAIQSGPQPKETLARLKALACLIVMGNSDAWLLSGDSNITSDTSSEAQQSIRSWSFSQLSDQDKEFIASFQPIVEVYMNERFSLLGFHGSPENFNDIILPTTPEDEFKEMLGKHSTHVCAGGHTHWQHLRRLSGSFFVNPGSVGWAYDRYLPESDSQLDPWAEYAILSSMPERVSVEFCRVPFDIQEYAHVIRTSGRPFGEELIARFSHSFSS